MTELRQKPILVYDGDCRFCMMWIDHWRTLTGERIDYAAYQDAAARFDVPEADFRRSVQLIMPDGRRHEGAEAVFLTLADVPGRRWLIRAYRHVPLFAPLGEAAYGFIARRRGIAYKATHLLWGNKVETSTYSLSRLVFLRTLALLFLIAFLSYFVQLAGLIGENGILPAKGFLAAVENAYGPAKWLVAPTFAWFGASDLALHGFALAGIAVSALALAGIAVGPAIAACYVLYLSLFVIGQDFLSYQWDVLLLEMGFLGMLFAPWSLRSRLDAERPPSAAVRWLYWLMLFRFMFNNGLVKLQSADPAWRDLTALSYHYFTQPLPNPLSWYVHQLPLGYHKVETLLTFGVELLLPFLILMPRRLRFACAGLWIAFQGFLFLTGNYAAYNLQAVALALLLFDDGFYRRFFPKKTAIIAAKAVASPRLWKPLRVARAGLIGLLFAASGAFILAMFTGGRTAGLAGAVSRILGPFHAIGSYGAFAVMTTTRPEIIVEGSDDGMTWKEYGFPFKAGDVRRAPPIVAPHHPRLDWQMWFLQFGGPQHHRWFGNFLVRLLQGSPDVLALLETNPFPVRPPKYVRALRYEYRFTTVAERRETGAWWVRELVGEYVRPISLEDLVLRARGGEKEDAVDGGPQP